MFKYFVSIKDNNQTLTPVAKLGEKDLKIQIALKGRTSIMFYLCALTEENKKVALHEIGNMLITDKMQKKNPSSIILETKGFNQARLLVTNRKEETIFKATLNFAPIIKKIEKESLKTPKLKSDDYRKSAKDKIPEKDKTLASTKPEKNKIRTKDNPSKKDNLPETDLNEGKTVLKVRHPLSVKLISIITIIVGFALGSIILLVNYFVSADVQVSAEENNFNSNTRAASDVQNRLETAISATRFFLKVQEREGTASDEKKIRDFFEGNSEIAAVIIPGTVQIENKTFFLAHEIEDQMISTMISSEQEAIQSVAEDGVTILNVSPYFNKTPLIAILSSAQTITQKPESLIILYSTNKISEAFGTNAINASFMVNEKGIILAHAQEELVLCAKDMSNLEIVQKVSEGSVKSRQLLFSDENGIKYFGAYTQLALGDCAIITMIAEDTIFESIRATTRRNIYLSLAVLAIAILIIWFFSRSISSPVKKLAKAAKLVQDGQYDIHLKYRHKDEIGLLTSSFVQMGKGLAERERLKDTFGRFTNKAIAEQAMRGELALGGETKNVTVFFSDIRNFTAMSEKLHPEEVVKFLNDYMTRMVDCVNKTGGTVDKFIGDAIMAVWGAPISGSSPKEDAMNAVRAALMMRSSLNEYNALRVSRGEKPIRIGCGINSGSVVAGQIGSNQRMEYTCIGDTVNLASRTEALNKPFATDILITANTYELIKDYITAEKMLPVTVKGKEKPIDMYAVVNIPDATDIPGAGALGPASMHQLRQRWGIKDPDLTGINTDDEEKKFNIKAN